MYLISILLVLFTLGGAAPADAATWVPLGPDGGDARSLTADPSNPDRIYLGTSAGELFLSTDGGQNWSRLAHLGSGYDYVLDSVVIDPGDPKVMYAGAWSVESTAGDVFKSTDGGQTWQPLPGVHGKSVRALALSPSDHQALAIGTLDGVYRSLDAGQTWEKLTPSSNPELRNFESIAFDPRSMNVIYAGTWHLPWKTEDGGRTWTNIKQGIIDDSDVFSIIVDQKNPAVVYVSACSGIYKSETEGKQFNKVQGIPFSARRTRVLQQDPADSATVYAGTTEGLWKTFDAGKAWARISPTNYVINDVLVDSRNPKRVLLATDRTGVLVSRDGGATFTASNRGFSHRQVTAVAVDNKDASRIYAAMVNNREFGGVYLTSDGGTTWTQFSSGLGTRDIFSLDQTESGALIAGTNKGVFVLERNSPKWKPINVVLREKVTTVAVHSKKKGSPKTKLRRDWLKSEITGRVAKIKVDGDRWFAATSQGLFRSLDSGHSWTGGPILGATDFVAVDSSGKKVFVATPTSVMLSGDGGETWSELKLPTFVSRISSVALAPGNELWIVTHMGAFRSNNAGESWEHSMAGNPVTNLSYIGFDSTSARLIGVAGARNQIVESRDGGETWTLTADSHYPIRNVAVAAGRILAVTEFNGVVAQPAGDPQVKSSGGGN